MIENLYRFARAIQEWAWGLTASPPLSVCEPVEPITLEARRSAPGASGANGLTPATGPSQMKRCASCGELARLYKTGQGDCCASCAKKKTGKSQ